MTQLTTKTNNTINLPVLSDPQGVAEVMEVNLEGIAASFPRIKFPSGGMLAFEVPSEEGSDVAKELVGVVIDQVSTNTYWSKKYDGQNNQPDCFSADGKIGTRTPVATLPWSGSTMECSRCPLNQYGSGDDGKGKACKNNRKLYLVREDEILPVEILIPPSSLKAWNTYTIALTSKVKPIDGVVTRIKLKKATSAGGIEYSEAVFQKVAELTPQEREAIRGYARGLRSAIRQQSSQPVEATPVKETDSDEEMPF